MKYLLRYVLFERALDQLNESLKVQLSGFDILILVYLGEESLNYEGIRKAGLKYGRSHSAVKILECVARLEELGLVLIDRSGYYHSICVSSSGYYILSSLENLLKKIRV